MKKLLICLLLCLLLPFNALAARMPAQRGPVTDAADVLSAQMVSDITEYAEKVEDEVNLELYTAVVHFLDGVDVQTYANDLFRHWDLDDDAVLVLLAAGEDACAMSLGKDAKEKLGTADNLLYTSSAFSTLIRQQRYDEAFADYHRALNALIEKQMGEKIRLGKLFGAQAAPAPSAVDFGSALWSDVMEAIEHSDKEYQVRYKQQEERDNGISAGGWIVLILLIVFVLRKKPVRGRRGRSGCGCSPLGWIFGLLGLGWLFHKD